MIAQEPYNILIIIVFFPKYDRSYKWGSQEYLPLAKEVLSYTMIKCII